MIWASRVKEEIQWNRVIIILVNSLVKDKELLLKFYK